MDLRNDYPTDPQAEVLVFGTIESSLIRRKVTSRGAVFDPNLDDLFRWRTDWRNWTSQPGAGS